MGNQSERLNDTAKKAKRNFLFITFLAWALTAGWVIIPKGKLSFGGIGAEASMRKIYWFLGAFLIYSLFEFWLHSPIGESRRNEGKFWMMIPGGGKRISAPKLFNSVKKIAGPNAFGKKLEEKRWKSG